MKIAIVNTWKKGAVHNIMYPMSQYINSLDGITCDYLTLRDDISEPSFDRSFDDYDIVHVGYFMNMQYLKDYIEVPYTCTVHHIAPHAMEQVWRFLSYNAPFGIVTADPFAQRQLGQMGINGVKLIDYSFDHSLYDRKEKLIPSEDNPITVAYLGCDSEAKRFNLIEEAVAQQPLWECNGIDRSTKNEEEGWISDNDILEMYERAHIYVSAGWNDGGPLPPQEALLMGLPVVTTRVGMMNTIIEPGINGEFFDGTVNDLRMKMDKIMDNYQYYRFGALTTALPKIKNTSHQYMELWTNILENEE